MKKKQLIPEYIVQEERFTGSLIGLEDAIRYIPLTDEQRYNILCRINDMNDAFQVVRILAKKKK